MANNVSVLNVLLYGKPIGTLTRVEGDRTLFAFNENYLADENRPTLSLGFKDNLGNLMTEFNPVRTRVMPFFSNLLPEGGMRTFLAERAGVNHVQYADRQRRYASQELVRNLSRQAQCRACACL